MLGAHGELAELSATEVDGFVTVEALHAETGYGIQRCYRSWGLAAADLAKWVQKLSCLNTTASEPRRPRACRKPGSYDDTARRPWAVGRAPGPGRPRATEAGQSPQTLAKPASLERQLIGILSNKCAMLEKELLKSQTHIEQLKGQCEHMAAMLANQAFPEAPANSNHHPAATNLFQNAVGAGYSEKELSRTIFNHINSVMATVHKLVGDDAVKALQLSDRVQQRARGQVAVGSFHDHKYTGMCVNVFQSIKSFLNGLSSRYNTKAPNGVRRIMQTVVTALMSHFDATSQRYLADKLELDRSWLSAGKARAMSFYEEGLLDCIAESHQSAHKN